MISTIKSEFNPAQLKVTLTEEKPPAISVIPFGKEKIAAIQVKTEREMASLPELPGQIGKYAVENAHPVAYTRSWPAGERTPGLCLLTLFRQKIGLTREDFLNRWHNGHTPLSLEIHPLWHYSRNVVLESEGTHYDGIVEEHCREKSLMLNPAKFFGGPIMMLPNMIRVYVDVRGFLDYSSVEPYMVSEYYFD